MFKRIILLLSLLLPIAAHAALDLTGIDMTASVNKTSLTMDDELVLTVTVDGAAGDFMPQLPSLPSFNVYARSASKQINNFHAISTFEYIMLPRFPGKAVIGPITLNYGNKTYKTDPITVTVYRAPATPTKTPAKKAASSAKEPSAANTRKAPAQAPANLPPLERDLYNLAAQNGDKDYFMIAAVSDKTPYINQTVTLAVRFYYALPFVGNAPYNAPTVSNLFMEEVSSSEGRQNIDGRIYNYIERRYAVSGVTNGPAQAGNASVRYISTSRFSNLSVLDRMVAAVSQEEQTALSNTVNLSIRALPQQGKPKSFYGAVGDKFTISASVDRNKVEAGEAINLTVKVNGSGNIKPTTDLKLPQLPGFKVYDVATTSGAVPSNGILKSYKIFKTVIVPVSSGKYTIPSLDWSYFNPGTKQYNTIRTQAINIEATPSSKTDTGFDFGAHSDLGNGFRQLGQDIRYLKSDMDGAKLTFLAQLSTWTWANYLFISLLALAGIFALMDKQTLAGRRALAKARAQLKTAYTEEAIVEALTTYLQVRYKVHTASLPLRDISTALQKHGCPAELAKRFETLWQRLDAARFAPVDLQGEGAMELARQATDLIKAMDKGGRR